MNRWGAAFGLGLFCLSCGGEAQDETPPAPAASECDVDADVLLTCTDETCDLDALEQELASCAIDTKNDGIGDTLREWMERIQQKLAERAQACFEEEDARCLRRVYWALAAGARVKGLRTAADNMWNFLSCGEDPLELDADDVAADEAVFDQQQYLRRYAWDAAVATLAEGKTPQTLEGTLPAEVVRARSADIWYGLGNFTVRGTVTASFAQGEIAAITLNYEAFDRYDWHVGMEAGGEASGVSSFRDEWAQFLVDEGEACEFDMFARWSETITEEPQWVDPEDGDGGRGEDTDTDTGGWDTDGWGSSGGWDTDGWGSSGGWGTTSGGSGGGTTG